MIQITTKLAGTQKEEDDTKVNLSLMPKKESIILNINNGKDIFIPVEDFEEAAELLLNKVNEGKVEENDDPKDDDDFEEEDKEEEF